MQKTNFSSLKKNSS